MYNKKNEKLQPKRKIKKSLFIGNLNWFPVFSNKLFYCRRFSVSLFHDIIFSFHFISFSFPICVKINHSFLCEHLKNARPQCGIGFKIRPIERAIALFEVRETK